MDFHAVGEKYMHAVVSLCYGTPLPLPVGAMSPEFEPLLNILDGILLPGSPSNVAPELYGAPPAAPDVLADPKRDAFVLPLIRGALARKIPMFCICRGMQELNVALGGSLYQELHEVEGRFDHRDGDDEPLEEAYGPRHIIRIEKDGLIHRISGMKETMVNSLHGQGIDRLANGLCVEAVAEDGTIESVSFEDRDNFVLGVQWHAEWKAAGNELSRHLFRAFSDALRVVQKRRKN